MADANRLRWAVSVVSHGHGKRVLSVLQDVHAQLSGQAHRLILTCNIPEDLGFLDALSPSIWDHLEIRKNADSQGFGANHNAALLNQNADFLLMADPDLQIQDQIFPAIEAALMLPDAGLVSPRAVTPAGTLEDNARPLLTPWSLFRRYLSGRKRDTNRISLISCEQPDWLAGLFLASRSEVFRQLHGFDVEYYMYCEDVDLALRARMSGLHCVLLEQIRIVHSANRHTLKRRQHLIWHLRSLFRLWRSPAYRALREHPQRYKRSTTPADKAS